MNEQQYISRAYKKSVLAAGIINIATGAWLIINPHYLTDILELPYIDAPILWNIIGIFIISFGANYMFAARNPIRFWPIIFSGLACKIAFPLLMIVYMLYDRCPNTFFVFILIHDIIWWFPFSRVLQKAYNYHVADVNDCMDDDYFPENELMSFIRMSDDEDLESASFEQPILLVFTRHSGCAFTKDTLLDLSEIKDDITASGVRLVVTLMNSDQEISQYLSKYKLENTTYISDPEMDVYKMFNLGKAKIAQIFSTKAIYESVAILFKKKVCHGFLGEDGMQMPGVFLIHRGKVVNFFIHQTIADRPPYMEIIRSYQNDTNNQEKKYS